jgi:hypothetical protein
MEEPGIRHDENVSQWSGCLHWSATGHGWFATARDGTQVCVSEETYERALRAYLECVGIERKTWTQIMQSAQEEWQRQCVVEHSFRSNLEQWLTCDYSGVQVIPGAAPCQRAIDRARDDGLDP